MYNNQSIDYRKIKNGEYRCIVENNDKILFASTSK